jgi:hypothetical protein
MVAKLQSDHAPRPALNLFRFTPLRGPDALGQRTLMTQLVSMERRIELWDGVSVI